MYPDHVIRAGLGGRWPPTQPKVLVTIFIFVTEYSTKATEWGVTVSGDLVPRDVEGTMGGVACD